MAAIYNDRPLSMYDNLHGTHATKETFNANATTLYDHLTNGQIELKQERQSPALPHDENHKTLNDGARNNEENVKAQNMLTAFKPNGNSINEIITPAITTTTAATTAATTTRNATNLATEMREKLKSSLPINSIVFDSTLHERPVIITNATTTATPAASIIIPTNNANNGNNNDTLTNRLSRMQTESAAFSSNSQQTTSELNETGHNIAAVKAALNEAKSKFFGLNSHYITQQKQQQQQEQQQLSSSTTSLYFDEINEIGNFYEKNSCMNEMHQQHQQQIEANAKPKPKYQNIPENSAIYRNHYQQQQQQQQQQPQQQFSSTPPTALHELNTNNIIINVNDIIREKSPAMTTTAAATTATATTTTTTTYKQILLNDIDNNSQQPSQAVYMATTVPQNIKGSKIAGRHTPTRSSLRHSRMLVVNTKNYQADGPHSSTTDFPHIRLIRWLIILQIIIASALVGLAMWQFLLAPNTSVHDNTYWSAFVLLFTGILNLNLIRYERVNNKHYKRHRGDHCFKFLRINSHVLSLLAIFLCVAALILAALHYGRLCANDTKCESSNILLEQGSCTCTFHYVDHLNDTNNGTVLHLAGSISRNDNKNQNYKFEYRDLSCQEVSGVWLTILTYSIVLNSIGAIITIIYIILLMCYRCQNKTKYNSIPTNL